MRIRKVKTQQTVSDLISRCVQQGKVSNYESAITFTLNEFIFTRYTRGKSSWQLSMVNSNLDIEIIAES